MPPRVPRKTPMGRTLPFPRAAARVPALPDVPDVPDLFAAIMAAATRHTRAAEDLRALPRVFAGEEAYSHEERRECLRTMHRCAVVVALTGKPCRAPRRPRG